MRSGRVFILGIIAFLFSFHVKGLEIVCNKEDSLIYKEYVQQFSGQQEKSFEELIVNTAKYFAGKPYVASTLEISDDSKLVVNLREFDCTTLVENCIALSATIKSGEVSFNNFCRILSFIRYRESEPKGYTSRLHYTTDWIYENAKKDILRNLSPELGGKNINKGINFMSSNPGLYRHLKDDSQNKKEIKRIEENINSRDNYCIIPVISIPKYQSEIRNGDIIAFATNIDGLDYSHIGIAYWIGKELHFIHASSRMKKVVIEDKSLTDYCKNSKSCSGISVLRIKD